MTTPDRFRSTRFPWPRIIAEATVIVVSILLAFAIDAWWDERTERLEEQRVLQQLAGEFEAASAQLDRYLDMDRRTLRNVARVDSLLQTALANGRSSITVRDTTLRWLISQGTFAPTLPTLDGLRTSGRLTIIEHDGLGAALSAWPTHLEDAVEHQRDSEELIYDLYPALARAAPMGPITDQILGDFGRLAEAPPDDAESAVSVIPELAGAVNMRTLVMHVLVMEFEDLQRQVARILELLTEAQARDT